MQKQNLIRKFFIMAALVVGLFVSGAVNNVYADGDGGGTIGSGTRSGYLGSGNRTPGAAPAEEQPSEFQIILDAFYKFIF
ncbi:MAG TPA: hypothetical protein VF604_07300 [Pyrinomonadaceae bacterium]|jgi:hypothetical protein